MCYYRLSPNAGLVLLCLIVWRACYVKGGSFDECSGTATNRTFTAYVGWPVEINCGSLISETNLAYYYEDDSEYGDEVTLNCSVYKENNGELVWTTKITIATEDYYNYEDEFIYSFEVGESTTPLKYLAVLQSESPVNCYKKYVEINVETLNDDCYQSQEKFPPRTECYEYSRTSTLHGYLPSADESYPLFVKPYDPSSKMYWIRDCNETSLETNSKYGESGELLIHSLNYTNVGVYTFVVEYEGKIRYVSHWEIQVQAMPSTAQDLIVTCTEIVLADIGSNATVDCVADLGVGKDNSIHYSAIFYMINETKEPSLEHENSSCYVSPDHGVQLSHDSHTSCHMIYDAVDATCYNKTISPFEAEIYQSHLKMTFTVINFQSVDAGSYEVKVRRVDVYKFFTFKLEVKESEKQHHLIIGLTVAAVFLLVVVLAFLFITPIIWFYKHSCAPYETLNEIFMAQLIYYTRKDGMSLSSQGKIKLIVQKLEDYICNTLHGDIYDSNRQVENGGIQNQLQTSFDKCARIIIILSEDYIKNDWNKHIVYEALKKKINSKKEVIFVELPGIKKSLKTLDKKSFDALDRAIKMNTVLKWGGGNLSSKFKMKLELAMPKVKPGKTVHGSGTDNDTYERAVI